MIHKVLGIKGPLCGNFKIGDDTSTQWPRITCPKCLAINGDGQLKKRQSRWKRKKLLRDDENDIP